MAVLDPVLVVLSGFSCIVCVNALEMLYIIVF